MSVSVKEIWEFLENLAPSQIAESQDNIGLQIGCYSDKIKGILLSVDPSLKAINYAIKNKLNLIITHHPLFYKPVYSIIKETVQGEKIYQVIHNHLNIISWHTPLDKIENGVSEAIIKALGYKGKDFILKNENYGLGRLVYLKRSIKLKNLAKKIKKVLHSWVMIVGNEEEEINAFGVCGGSCSFLKEKLKSIGINTLITSDVKYHTAKDAQEEGFNFIIVDHGISESFILDYLKDELLKLFNSEKIQIPIIIFKENSPYKII
ncbi:MAG: Nif3-like dinuclear metal center hexameric protein [Thermodesulfobacteriota bacterium]|nr:MAG: Nif3-like dinuclear metal center hexameric protein [Thermodesulfobacteriota bacterium]RLG13027.1 MAG: Nif3-like dinuclear metal center hexameric protein [Candidatus Pacearchaeota archaeon]